MATPSATDARKGESGSTSVAGGSTTWRGRLECIHGSSHVLADILRLPAEERARLAPELIRSLDGEPDADAAQAWDFEIERRGAEVDSDVGDTMTLDEYRAHVRQRRAARAKR